MALQTGTIPRGRLSMSPHRSRRSRCPRSISDNPTRAPRLKSANHLRRAGRFAHGRRTQTVSRLRSLRSVPAQSQARAMPTQEPRARFSAPKSQADVRELPELRYRALETPLDQRTYEVARVREGRARRESGYSRRAPTCSTLFDPPLATQIPEIFHQLILGSSRSGDQLLHLLTSDSKRLQIGLARLGLGWDVDA